MFFSSMFRNLFEGRSYKWSSVRKEHLKENNYCSACGRRNNLEVHHIEPVHKNPDKELDPDNLITLCSSHCHFVFGHLMDYKSWNVDVVKDCSSYMQKIKNRPYKEQ